MSLAPPPSPSLRSRSLNTPSSSAPPTPSLKGKEKEEAPSVNGSTGPTPITSPVLPSSPLQGDGAASLAAEAVIAGAAGANGVEQAAPKPAQAAKREDKSSENAFRKMPPEIVAILLPFYDLLNLNKAFCALVFNETSEGGESWDCFACSARRADADSLPLATSPHFPLSALPSFLPFRPWSPPSQPSLGRHSQERRIFHQPSSLSPLTSSATPPPHLALAHTPGCAFSSSSCSSRKVRGI
jgi:hypothetical protein